MINCITYGQLFGKYDDLNPIYEGWVSLVDEINSQSPPGMQEAIMSGGLDFAWLQT